jgi:succinyl-CoA synthetase alpha subunit
MSAVVRAIVKPNFYQDSVALMRLAAEVKKLPGVQEAAAMMGTEANKAILAEAGLEAPEMRQAHPNDLILAVRAGDGAAAQAGLAKAEELLLARQSNAAGTAAFRPRTLETAVKSLSGANLALISVPGEYAEAEAGKALRLGLHVLLFSDNVPVEAERRLKDLAISRDLLMMGPDCGTALIGGVPLAFANVVPRGAIGIVSASGTGLQQVSCLLANAGEGVSHGIGVGGRDLSDAIEGRMTLHALRALAADRATEVLVLISKPPSPSVAGKVIQVLEAAGKPGVVCFLGLTAANRPATSSHLTFADTLEDAALAAVTLRRGQPFKPTPFSMDLEEAEVLAGSQAHRLRDQQGAIRGIFAGGTLAHEAALILEGLAGPVASNLKQEGLKPEAVEGHAVWDVGADEFTRGRPHPMIDSTVRREFLRREANDPSVGVILFDIVLGHGAHPDPAGDLLPGIEAAKSMGERRGRRLVFVASICGTSKDLQKLEDQAAKLEDAGVVLMPSNAQAARLAALVATRGAAMARLRAGC